MIVPPTVDQAPKISWGLFYFAVKLSQIIITYPIDKTATRYYKKSKIFYSTDYHFTAIKITVALSQKILYKILSMAESRIYYVS